MLHCSGLEHIKLRYKVLNTCSSQITLIMNDTEKVEAKTLSLKKNTNTVNCLCSIYIQI